MVNWQRGIMVNIKDKNGVGWGIGHIISTQHFKADVERIGLFTMKFIPRGENLTFHYEIYTTW